MTLFATIAEGMAFGAGATIACIFLNNVFGTGPTQYKITANGPFTVSPAATKNSVDSDACNRDLQDCLKSNENDISKCQIYMDKLVECRRNS